MHGLAETFGQRLQKAGRMIILLDTYDKPHYTTRVWCIYETYIATARDIRIDVALLKNSALPHPRR